MYPSKDANNQHIYQIIYKQQKALRYLKSCIKQAMLMHHTATLTVMLIFHDYQNKDANNGSIAISVRMLAKFHGNSIDKAF